MGKRKRLKGAKPDAEDLEFARLQESVAHVVREVAGMSGALKAELEVKLPAAFSTAIAHAVHPYLVSAAMEEKAALVEMHPGWGADRFDIHRFPGVLV